MTAMSASRADTFTAKMQAHLHRCFPAECAQLGEPGVGETIRYGMDRAGSYGITTAREVCTYIDLMMALGRDFDRDEQLPWASSILKSKWKSTSAKLDQLYRKAKEHRGQQRTEAS